MTKHDDSTPISISPLLDQALERLYQATPADFVRVRKQLVSELKAAGELTAARRIGDKHKPSRSAWAINQVARREPELIASLIDARVEAAGLQSGTADGGSLRAALDAHRKRAAEVLAAAARLLEESGVQVSQAERRQLAQTLEAASADESTRRELKTGRLDQSGGETDPVLALTADGARARAHERPKSKPEDARARAEEKRLQAERARDRADAKKKVAELERAHKSARAAEVRARERAEQAKAEAEAASSELERIERTLGAARAALRELEESD